jgi:hypothetical protein
MKNMRRFVIALTVAALGALALPSTSGATVFPLEIELVSPSAPLTFQLTILSVNCNDGSFSVDEVFDGNNDLVTPVSVTEDPSNPNVALMVLPDDMVAGELTVVARCLAGSTPEVVEGSDEWGNLAVTKVVEGTPPPDATFTVNADCEGLLLGTASTGYGDVSASAVPNSFVVDLEYPATGGVGHVYTDHSTHCALTEPNDGGATSVVIDPELVTDLEEPGSTSATVTNSFAAAAPIVVEPTFTG